MLVSFCPTFPLSLFKAQCVDSKYLISYETKGIARHVSLNKKVLVRDRLRAIMDEDAEFFELSTTAGK